MFPRLSTAAADPGMSTALRSLVLLDILSSTPAGSIGCAPCIHARLRRLASTPGEKCGPGNAVFLCVGALAQTMGPLQAKMRLSIIVNPIAGGGRAYRRLERRIRNWPYPDWEVELHLTRAPGHAGAIARKLSDRPPDRLAICGGDGTINEVISGIAACEIPIAVLPAGTANVLAREIGLPLDPWRALEVALQGTVR